MRPILVLSEDIQGQRLELPSFLQVSVVGLGHSWPLGGGFFPVQGGASRAVWATSSSSCVLSATPTQWELFPCCSEQNSP